MIDVKNKMCEFGDCRVQPYFNYPGEKRARFCSEHQLPDMIDVKHVMCEFGDCRERPSFNYLGEKVPVDLVWRLLKYGGVAVFAMKLK
jgi:hypothetical protein